MKAHLIDPKARMITTVEVSSLEDIRKLIVEDITLDKARLDAQYNCVFVDDLGYYRPEKHWFTIEPYGMPLANRGVVTRLDDNAPDGLADTTLSLEEIQERVKFIDDPDLG